MASTYTTNLGLEKPGTGDQAGSWGTTMNTNFDLIDEDANGIVSVTLASAGTSGSPNTLDITNATSSNGRNKFITITDGGDLGADVFVQLTPNDAEKICFIKNALSGSQDLYLFQGTYNASNDLVVTAGTTVMVKFDGGGAGATVTEVLAGLEIQGDLTVSGTLTATIPAAVGKQTIWIPANAMTPTTTSGADTGQVETTAGRPDAITLDFINTTDEYAQFSIAMPKQWNEGTITFKAFWSVATSATTGVAWALQAVAVADNGSFDTVYGTAVVVTDDAQSGANEIYVTDESGAITVAGSPAAGELTFFQVYRDVSDANDDYPGDARLHGIQIFWTNDTTVDD